MCHQKNREKLAHLTVLEHAIEYWAVSFTSDTKVEPSDLVLILALVVWGHFAEETQVFCKHYLACVIATWLFGVSASMSA